MFTAQLYFALSMVLPLLNDFTISTILAIVHPFIHSKRYTIAFMVNSWVLVEKNCTTFRLYLQTKTIMFARNVRLHLHHENQNKYWIKLIALQSLSNKIIGFFLLSFYQIKKFTLKLRDQEKELFIQKLTHFKHHYHSSLIYIFHIPLVKCSIE